MRFYLLRKGREFVVYRVKDDHVFAFLQRYHRDVLVEAASMMQLLILFERDWLFDIFYDTV